MNFQQTNSVFEYDNQAISQRWVSSVGQGDPGRGRGGCGGGGGGGNCDACKPTQEEIHACCTHIVAKRYDKPDYDNFNAAKSQTLAIDEPQ